MAVNAPATGAPRPNLTLGGEMTDFEEFLGVVIADEWKEGTYGWQWWLAVKPVDYDIQGKTGAWHTYYRHTTRKNSAMGAARLAMQKVFPADLKVGEGNLVGQACWWIRKDLSFGVNKQTGEEMVAEGVLIPVRTATPEEQQRAAAKGANGSSPAVAHVAAATAHNLGDAELTLVKELAEARTAEEISAAALTNKGLPRGIKQGLISGELLDSLVAAEELYLDGDKYSAVPF